MLRIITAAIAGSVMIFVICTLLSKKGWPTKMPGIGAGWKIPFVFLWTNLLRPKKLIMWTIIIGAVYGIYLLACYCWPTPERLAFKELSKNLAEIELKPEKDKLAALGAKIKDGKKLTETEKREAMEADEKIRRVRKDYSGGKLVPPQPRSASAKPKEEVWDWTFKWERNDKQWEEAKKAGRKKKGEEYPARLLDITPSQLTMEYVSGYSGKPKKVVLGVGNTGDFWAADYFIKSKNPKEIDLSLKVSLYKDPESPGNFTGIFWQDQDGQQVDCWLSKK